MRTMAMYHADDDNVAVILMNDVDATFAFRIAPATWMQSMVDVIRPHNVVCGTRNRVGIETRLPSHTMFVTPGVQPDGISPIRVVCKIMDAYCSQTRVLMTHKVRSTTFPFEEWMTWINWPREASNETTSYSTTSPFSSSVCTN